MAADHIPHLKKNTAGTSNELSFDVLDAARNELDGKKSKGVKGSFGVKLPTAKQGSSEGIGSSSTLSAQDEIRKRKKKRRVSIWRRRIIAAVVLIAVAVGVGMLAYGVYKENRDFAGRYNDLVAEFVDTDKTLVEVDRLMGDPLDAEAAEDRERIAQKFNELTQHLGAVDNKARELAAVARDEQAKSAVARISDAANARIEMTQAASNAFKLSEEAFAQTARAKEIWESLLDADQLVRQSVELANSAYDQATTQQSQSMAGQALEAFRTAKSQIEQLEAECPGLSLSAQKAYIDKRIEAIEAMIAVGDALLRGDRQAATERNDAYNRADQEAARMASTLPLSLADPVMQSFKVRMEKLVEAYAQARENVSESDAVIRDYLGERK